MSELEEELPEIAGEIRKLALVHVAVKEALDDFDTACRFEEALQDSESERNEWARIRKETALELRRLVARLKHPLQDSEGAS